MNRLSLFLTMLALIACGEKELNSSEPKPGTTRITAVPGVDLTALSSEAGTFTVSVLSDGDWSITSDSPWMNPFPSGGVKNETTEVSVKVVANDGFEGRDGSLVIRSGGKTETLAVRQKAADQIRLSNTKLMCGADETSFSVVVTSNVSWQADADADWCAILPASGSAGETEVRVTAAPNTGEDGRTARLAFRAGTNTAEATLTQYSDHIDVPDGYSLVWHDEFNEGPGLGSDWKYEVKPSGWVNNELQNYVKNPVDGRNTVEVENGFLHINCFKGSDGKVYSGRVYAMPDTGWTYGYIEARINLPSGKGTWPAFWMMPVHFTGWPDSGEMDIMEEVGVVPNEVSSSLHAKGHYHVENTQVTKARMLDGAEGSFHVYAMEWTPDKITTYVDGAPLLTYANDGGGDYNWPYHTPFYVILNLAWGGDWGGMKGVDESALPVTLLVDYVRVFQKL